MVPELFYTQPPIGKAAFTWEVPKSNGKPIIEAAAQSAAKGKALQLSSSF
jgi:hypothetical protein